jgi:hypothetical protein
VLDRVDELARQGIALVMVDARPAEHLMLDRTVAGHHVDPPAAAGDVVERGSEFGEMQWTPRPVEHMHRRDQQDAAGHCGERAHRDEGVECRAIEHAAIAALGQPLRQPEYEIEAEGFCPLRQHLVVIEGPGRRPRQGGRAPSARLDRQEETEQQRLGKGLGERAIRKVRRHRKG